MGNEKPGVLDLTTEDHAVELKRLPDGRNQIVFRKAHLKGKITSKELLDTILIAAKIQAELFIEKLSRGTSLEVAEIKALKELSEIAKIDVQEATRPSLQTNSEGIDRLKQSLYQALTEKSKQ